MVFCVSGDKSFWVLKISFITRLLSPEILSPETIFEEVFGLKKLEIKKSESLELRSWLWSTRWCIFLDSRVGSGYRNLENRGDTKSILSERETLGVSDVVFERRTGVLEEIVGGFRFVPQSRVIRISVSLFYPVRKIIRSLVSGDTISRVSGDTWVADRSWSPNLQRLENLPVGTPPRRACDF